MKRILFLIAFAQIAFASIAQKQNIQSAINYLKEDDIVKAKKMIEDAVNNESTKGNAKAWMLRGIIYQAILTPKEIMPKMVFMLNENLYNIDLATANELKTANPNAFSEAIESYKKVVSLDPKYNKDELTPLVTSLLFFSYNAGISLMNQSQYNEALKAFDYGISIIELDNSKLWKGSASIDTISANCKMYKGYCYYQMGKEDEAIPYLEEAIKNPISQNADLYIMLSEVYEHKNNDAKWSETMKAAKAKHPNDKRILNNEINYYIKSGKAEESITKLKEGIAADPKKGDLYILLGQTYYSMANPTDKSGKALARPANAADLEKDALSNYEKAIQLDPNDYYPQFYIGILYYNNAKMLTDEMNKADDKKYKELEPKRNEYIQKAITYLAKSKSILEAEKKIEENKENYKTTISGLMQGYMILDQNEKSAEMQKILNSIK